MAKAQASPIWIELSLDRADDDIRIAARGSRTESIPARSLGSQRDIIAMLRFADAVKLAASNTKPLSAALLADAQAIERSMLAGGIEPLLARLRGRGGDGGRSRVSEVAGRAHGHSLPLGTDTRQPPRRGSYRPTGLDRMKRVCSIGIHLPTLRLTERNSFVSS